MSRQRDDYWTDLFAGTRRLRWSADRLAFEREQRLREILAWSIEHSPFHRERLAGVDLERFSEADLSGLPTMTKADMMRNYDRLVTDRSLTLNLVNTSLEERVDDEYILDRYRAVVSSGTTGVRGTYLFDWMEWCHFATIATRWDTRNNTILPSQPRVGTLFATDTRHVSGALHAFFKSFSGEPDPDLAHLPAHLPIPEITAGLNAAQPQKLQGYPSAIHVLALEAMAGRLKISPLVVATCGEQCQTEVRKSVREAWGIEIYDYWGCAEGVYAFPCDAGRAMHLPDDMSIIEPVDRDGNVVPFGVQADKILLTNLYNRTQPLIRYEITDSMKVLADPCPCGCTHRRIDNLAGRSDDFFTYQGDVLVHWLGMDNILFRSKSIAEFQVTQTRRGVDIALVTRGNEDTDALRQQFIDLLERSGLEDPVVDIHSVAHIERTWTGKLEQFQPMDRN